MADKNICKFFAQSLIYIYLEFAGIFHFSFISLLH